MKNNAKKYENGRPYRLAHQTLCITSFNFETESLVGHVEMLIYPLSSNLKRIKLNCKQCKIYRVAINENIEADYIYFDPTLDICSKNTSQRNLDFYEQCHAEAVTSVEPDEANGEIIVKLPQDILSTINELASFRVNIEFSLNQPRGGINFVVADADGTLLERGAHLFTYGLENSSRLWFPCIDSYSEVCTWKMEYTVHMYMTAVSCGDLIDTVYTTDLRRKTYHYYLSTPTSASNIALAVGPFEVLVDPNMHEVTHFCLPHLTQLLKHTTSFIHEVFEFYEDLVSCRFPYSCYKQVFVDMAYSDVIPYASLSICSTNLLHSQRLIDQTLVTRQLLSDAIASQFFGCFISMHTWSDAWLLKGLSSFLYNRYAIKAFGMNAYRYTLARDMESVCAYEIEEGPIILDPSTQEYTSTKSYFSVQHPHTIFHAYHRMFDKKSHLVISMLEKRVGSDLLLQVLNKLLTLASNSALQKYTSNMWSNMVLSTSSFIRSISTATGKDILPFVQQWVQKPGCIELNGSFVFNRKRNNIEIEITQDCAIKNGVKYAGPLSLTLQELDGSFSHTFMLEEHKTRFEISCHSKSRRQKKKKIPLCTGEEVDMNLNECDQDSPVLWIRIDPEMTIFRRIRFEQADFMYGLMLLHERCVIAQLDAVQNLKRFPTINSRIVLSGAIENENFYYQIRLDAINCLIKIANTASGSNLLGHSVVINLFRSMYGSPQCQHIIRRNNFNNFQQYFIQKAFPIALSKLRNIHNVCPQEVLYFLLDLFKYNDNSKNKYSDCYYLATLIDSLVNTLSPAVTPVSVTGLGPSTDALTADTRLILEEITRCLNMEKLLPSYKLLITVSCLKAIRQLQKNGHLPCDPCIFKSYALVGNFVDVRLSALEALVDFVAVESSSEILDYLMDVIENDSNPYLRFKVVCMLQKNPPFDKKPSILNNEYLVNKLWTFMTSTFFYDSRIRCAIANLYYVLFGRTKPSCLQTLSNVPKEKKKVKSTNIFEAFMNEEASTSQIKKPKTSLRTRSSMQLLDNPLKIKVLPEKRDDSESLKPLDADIDKNSPIDVESGSPVPMAEFEVTVVETKGSTLVVDDIDGHLNLSEDSSSSGASSPRFKSSNLTENLVNTEHPLSSDESETPMEVLNSRMLSSSSQSDEDKYIDVDSNRS